MGNQASAADRAIAACSSNDEKRLKKLIDRLGGTEKLAVLEAQDKVRASPCAADVTDSNISHAGGEKLPDAMRDPWELEVRNAGRLPSLSLVSPKSLKLHLHPQLLHNGVDVMRPTSNGTTALHEAALRGDDRW